MAHAGCVSTAVSIGTDSVGIDGAGALSSISDQGCSVRFVTIREQLRVGDVVTVEGNGRPVVIEDDGAAPGRRPGGGAWLCQSW